MIVRLIVCLLPLVLSACAPVIIGGAAIAGTMALQERGMRDGVSDTKTKAVIKDRLAGINPNYIGGVGVDVVEGNVLLTGVVASSSEVADIVEAVRQSENVGAVYNELMVGDYTIGERSSDTWVSTQLRTRLVANSDVFTINYNITVIKGRVFIYGIARNPAEKERALHIIRTTKGVQAVHDYIRLSTE